MFNIDEFAANISSQGVSRPSHFAVSVVRSNDPDPATEFGIQMRCMETDLPGFAIATHDHTYHGPVHKIATGTSFVDQTLSIILSADMREKRYFEKWRSTITGRSVLGEQSREMFALSFYRDYIGTVDIALFDDLGRESYRVRLHEAYPIAIGTSRLSWASGNELLILPVTFAYYHYSEEGSR